MSELFGVDIAPYPAHLATVALASKLLAHNPDIYPNIIREDFLNMEMVIPMKNATLQGPKNEKK